MVSSSPFGGSNLVANFLSESLLTEDEERTQRACVRKSTFSIMREEIYMREICIDNPLFLAFPIGKTESFQIPLVTLNYCINSSVTL